jgi:hypothetical protein
MITPSGLYESTCSRLESYGRRTTFSDRSTTPRSMPYFVPQSIITTVLLHEAL